MSYHLKLSSKSLKNPRAIDCSTRLKFFDKSLSNFFDKISKTVNHENLLDLTSHKEVDLETSEQKMSIHFHI
jgi:hypothetical protein